MDRQKQKIKPGVNQAVERDEEGEKSSSNIPTLNKCANNY